MDALTRQIRRGQWLQIIEACSNRSEKLPPGYQLLAWFRPVQTLPVPVSLPDS